MMGVVGLQEMYCCCCTTQMFSVAQKLTVYNTNENRKSFSSLASSVQSSISGEELSQLPPRSSRCPARCVPSW
uniref:Uncharacterized protein n=1 Tax=Oryza brachyantha TaxID=4533 RepID=J3MUQ4_ORYBR